jgi:hypothetical protein
MEEYPSSHERDGEKKHREKWGIAASSLHWDFQREICR